jgi:hypothetical protein
LSGSHLRRGDRRTRHRGKRCGGFDGDEHPDEQRGDDPSI